MIRSLMVLLATFALMVACAAPEPLHAPRAEPTQRTAQRIAIGDASCSAEDCRCTDAYFVDGVCDGIVRTGQTSVAQPSYVRVGNSSGSSVNGALSPPSFYETGYEPGTASSTVRFYVNDVYWLWRTAFSAPVSPAPTDRYGWVEAVYSFPSVNDTLHIIARGDIATAGPPEFEVFLADGNNALTRPLVYLTAWTNGATGATKVAHPAAFGEIYNVALSKWWEYHHPDLSTSETFGGPDGHFPGWYAY